MLPHGATITAMAAVGVRRADGWIALRNWNLV